MTDTADASLLAAMLNMTEFHHEHEKFYSVSPREQAVTLQRHSRTLHALADRWTATTPTETRVTSRYAGAPDLNAPVATQLDGVLFMEGEGEPSEITQLKRDLRLDASDAHVDDVPHPWREYEAIHGNMPAGGRDGQPTRWH